MKEVVPDANTLIYLAKADILEILDRYRVFVGEKVYQEAVVSGKEKDVSDAYILEKHIEENFERIGAKDSDFEREFKYFGAPGETEVYLITDQKGCTAVTSDSTALNKMRRKDVEAIRTDMLLLRQLKNEHIGKKRLENLLTDLKSVNGTTSERFRFIIKKAEKIKGGEN
ncbi:MAG: hypothetical protein ABEK16_06680 [Candidatus Nanohalobium sp.]